LWQGLLLSSLLVLSGLFLGIGKAKADTATLNYDGYSRYEFYTPIALPAGVWYYQCRYNEGFTTDNSTIYPSTNITGDWWQITVSATSTAGSFAYFPVDGTVQNCGSPVIFTTLSPETYPAVAFYNPTNVTTTADFDFWELTLSNVTTTDIYRVDVEYQQFGGGTTYDDFNLITPTYPVAQIVKTQALLPGNSYTATAYLINSTSTSYFIGETDPGDVLSSTTITFTIGTSTPATTIPASSTLNLACGPPPAPFFQLTGTIPYFSVGNPFDSIYYGGCVVLTFAFIPNSGEQNDISSRFDSVWTEVSTKPPFGYFTIVAGDLNGLSTASSSATSTEIIQTSSTEAFGGVFSPLSDGFITILWLLFGFWLFHRLRNMNFS
jgi:hypothetical protein